jgi:hypothetical protein
MESFTNFLDRNHKGAYGNNPFLSTKTGYLLSIQGSYTHYSEPRESDLPWEAYSKLEVAIAFRPKEENKEEFWVYPPEDPYLNDLTICEYFEEKPPVDWAPCVAGYVPVDLIQELFERCGGV